MVMAIGRVASFVALLTIALWLGGLLALGALAAPVVFSVVPLPLAADAMTIVFRRFDVVAMTCAAVMLLSEALRAAVKRSFAPIDIARGCVSALAAVAAVLQGLLISPRIAGLHSEGVSRGLGASGMELSRLHDLAELLGQAQVVLLASAIAIHVASLSQTHQAARGPS